MTSKRECHHGHDAYPIFYCQFLFGRGGKIVSKGVPQRGQGCGARGWGKGDGQGGWGKAAKGSGIYILIKFSTKQLEH